MPRGGAANRSQWGILFWSLLATPACGLVVGFEPRELCDDCPSSSADAIGGGAATSSGGASSTGNITAAGGSEGSAEGAGAVDTASGAGGSVSGSAASGGGTAGSDTGVGGNAAGGSSTGSSGSSTSSSMGGTNTGGGTTDTDAGGTGGEMASSTGGANTGGAGTGGTSGGGSGGDVGSTTTTAAGGSASVGGTGGLGGTGGTPSPCSSEDSFDVTESTGTHPAALMLRVDNSSRSWDFSWIESDDIYVSARSSTGSVLLDPTLLDDTGTHGASAIATHSQYAFIAYGEFASGNARIVMNRLNPLEPETVDQDDTGTLDGDAAPRVVGITRRGSTSDMLVAAIGSDGSGLLALFSDGQYITSQTLPGSLDDLTPFDLGGSFAIAYIEDGSLQVALVPYDLSEVEPAAEIEEALPIAPALGSLDGSSTDSGAALVWLEANGVYLTTVDDDGLAERSPISVAPGTNVLPKVEASGAHLFVSWIDTTTDTLYLQRVPGDLSSTTEQPFAVEDGVTDVRYGLGADGFSSTPTLALVYSTDRLRMSILTCP